MPYAITIDEQRRVVTVTVTGVVDADLARPMVTDARAAAVPRGFGVLYDFRGAVPGNVQNTDVFWYSRNIPALAAPEARRVRVAVLHRAAQREIMHFWETTFSNVGLQARAFEDENDAHAWLGAMAKA